MPLTFVDLFDLPIQKLEPATPITVPCGTSVDEATRLLQTHRIGCVLVTRGKDLAGIFTERDLLLKVLTEENKTKTTTVDQFMTPDPESLRPHDSIAYALNRMSLGGFRHIPIVDAQEQPIGIISVKDIVDLLVNEFPEAVMNLPPEPRVYPNSPEGA